MDKLTNLELRVVLSIFGFAIILGLIGIFIRHNYEDNPLLSPLSNTFSFFSELLRTDPPSHVIYGFLPYWELASAKYIKTSHMTDIAYFGLRINSNGTIQRYQNGYELEPGYNHWRNNSDLKKLIKKAKSTNTNVALTIISHEADISDYILYCESCWNTLANEIIDELKYHELKDINLNFEYASYTEEKTALQYSKLAKYINERLDEEFGGSYVVVSAFADSMQNPRVTHIPSLHPNVDGIFIMAYDFYQVKSETSGPNSPLKGAGDIASYDLTTMVNDYLSQVNPKKLILGVPYYGYNWLVESEEPFATRIPGTEGGPVSQTQGYNAIQLLLEEQDIVVHWEPISATPYFSYISPKSGLLRQVWFDSAESLRIKYRLAKSNNFAGIGIWALGYDENRPELWNLIKEEFIDTNE